MSKTGKKVEHKSGRNAKIQIIVDALGDPLAFLLSPGDDHDSKHAVSLLSQVDIEVNNILGDKAYGAKVIRIHRMLPILLHRKVTLKTRSFVDWYTYKERHQMECFFKKLK